MHLVSNDKHSVHHSTSAIATGAGWSRALPLRTYPLALNGLGRLRPPTDPLFGGAATGAFTPAAQRKAAAELARQAAEDQRKAKQAEAQQKRQAQQQAHKAAIDDRKAARVQAQADHHATIATAHAAKQAEHAANSLAHKQAAVAAKQNRQAVVAARHEAAAADHALKSATHGKLSKQVAAMSKTGDAAALKASLDSFKAELQSKLAAAKAKLESLKAKASNRRLRGLMGLLGLRGMGDTVIDPVSGQYIDSVTGAPANPDPNSFITQPTINPVTGQPIATTASSGSDPMMAMIMQMMQSNQGTPPKNCKAGSSKPVCVFYYADQQNKQILGILLQEIMQMNDQINQVNQQIMALIGQLGDQQQQPNVDANGNMIQPAFDPYGNIGPSAQIPVQTQFDPYAQDMPPMPYAPGGGVPQMMDPNLPPQYAGMPSMSDPYGDVATIPDGYGGDGSGAGAGADMFIPDSIPVSMGPTSYMDFAGDVQALPDMSDGSGYGGGNDYLPMGVDAYAGPMDAMQMQPMVPAMQPVPMAQQALPAPQSAIAKDRTPQPIIPAAANEQQPDVLGAEDQGLIMAEAFGDASDMGA